MKARGTVVAVRRRQLIRLLSLAVALNMAVGVVALAARRGDGHDSAASGSQSFAGSVPVSGGNGGGILAGGSFTKRRGSKGGSSARTTGPPATTAPGTTPSTATGQPVTTGRPPASTPSTQPAPGGTTVTSRPSQATPSAAGAPATSTTSGNRSPGTTAPHSPTTATSAPPTTGRQDHDGALTDPAGDTTIDGTPDPINEPRADIVRARATYEPGRITLVMQVQRPSDPRQDARWAGDATFATWSVDTNGDGAPDFEIQYFLSDGKLAGSVSKPGDDGAAIACNVSSGYGPDGYSVTVDPACLGNPASFSYRVTMYYDTNPKDDNANVASDVAPNGGMSFPVARPN